MKLRKEELKTGKTHFSLKATCQFNIPLPDLETLSNAESKQCLAAG